MINMELWEKIIIEWINCLEIQKEPVKSITELQDGTFYINFLKSIKWIKHKEDYNQEDIVIKFLKDEYPSFKINKNDNIEHIYIASLLLVHLCRILSEMHHSLPHNMCDNLKYETQVRVKAFLENILPLGKNITKETMREVIMEVEDISINANSYKTPSKKIFNSPTTCSTRSKKIITERIRELRDLRSSLAVEQFTNADLRDEVMRQQDKIQKLQRKLKEKSVEVKAMREEWIKSSPQPSCTKEDTSQKDYYQKYINDLESQLSKQQNEINKLETEKDSLSKKLFCVQRTSVHYKENFASCERSIEYLSNQIEIKDRELVELRIHNEELRTHVNELNKNSNMEQSFEDDLPLPARMSLNTSEALSSVIDIQLQEAKEESAILHAQIDSLKEKMDILTKNYKTAMESNRDLQNKVEILDQVQEELNNLQEKLNISKQDLMKLQAEKISLVTQNEDLKGLLSTKEKELSETEQWNITLSTELDNLKVDMKELNELLENEKINSSNLNTTLAQTKSQITEHLAYIHKLTNERDLYKSSIENCSESLKNILHFDNQYIQVETDNLNNMELNDLTKYFKIMLHNCNTVCASNKCHIEELKVTIDETNTNLLEQQIVNETLKEQNTQNLLELTNIKEEKKQMNLLLNEQKENIYKYLQEIEVLKEIRNEKCVLEQNVCELTNDLINKELILKSLMIQLEHLQDVNKDFKLIKEKTQQNISEYKKNIELMFEKLQHSYQTLHYSFHKVQQEKEELEYNFNHTKEELSNAQTINNTFQQHLLEIKEITTALEEKEKTLYNELNDSKQIIQRLEEMNKTLEEHYITLKIEANNNSKNLTSENAKISLELENTTVKLNLLQQEINDTMTQMELKKKQNDELLLNISSLEAEKQYLIQSHKEVLETKDVEIQMKEESLLILQTKIEKLASETSAMEKMIINLQEVRSSQDAVLETQKAALKEKCLYIKELEDTKLSLQEYQHRFFYLENEINSKNRIVAEMEETINNLSAELETNIEQYKLIDANQTEIIKLCLELKYPIKNLNSTIMERCPDFEFLDQNLHSVSQYECNNTDDKTTNILNIIKMTLNELHKSQQVILLLSCANVELNKTLTEQKILIENSIKDKEEASSLKDKVRELEIIAQKRNDYLKNLIKSKKSLKDSLQKVFASQNDLDIILTSSRQKWNDILTKFQDIFHTDTLVCDEFKQLQAKQASLKNILSKHETNYLQNIKSVFDILWDKFLWTEQKLHDTYLCSVHEKECLDVLTGIEEDQFPDERMIIDIELEKQKALQTDIIKSNEEIESFITLATCYETNLKSGKIKSQSEIQKNLQKQINQLTKEKTDVKNKMDTMRIRNVKLEKNIDDLRTEIKKLKSTDSAPMEANLKEMQSLKDELEHLKKQNQQLHEEKDESSKTAKQEFENQLKEVHATYDGKLEDMKQKIKTAYNEQMSKLNKDQEKIIQEKLQTQMEAMCQKKREEVNRYKMHVSDLTSQLWSVGEKLLIEQQQKQDMLQHIRELQTKLKEVEMKPISIISHKTCTMEKQEMLPENAQAAQKVTTLITEETFQRRHSIRSMQAMGDMFKTEDEEEVFDNVYLADMKRGNNCFPITNTDRLSILQMRNSLCKPHLKSSYPAEMQFLPSTLTEEEIKTGSSVEDNFNDSLSQSLLPEQKAKKKDRTQTSYKKPGPPTPSKNGGKLLLQSNETKSPSSRILKERNMDRRTTTTPHSLKNIFSLKRQDENATSTPKGRRLSSLFRKPRM